MILVTGGAGYIGSHLVMALLEKGEDIVIFDSLELVHKETIEKLGSLGTKGNLVDFIQGNLQNFSDIESVFKKHKIDAVVHFAAFSQVGESVINPQKYYFNNVYGSLNLFRSMLENNVKKIVFPGFASFALGVSIIEPSFATSTFFSPAIPLKLSSNAASIPLFPTISSIEYPLSFNFSYCSSDIFPTVPIICGAKSELIGCRFDDNPILIPGVSWNFSATIINNSGLISDANV